MVPSAASLKNSRRFML